MEKDEIKAIKFELDQFTGTQHYYRYYLGILFTDGIKYLAEKLECFWFLDIIASYQAKIKHVPFQIWRIKRNTEGHDAVVTMSEDSDQSNIIQQEIPYTDFSLDEYEVYFIDGVIILKSEY